MSLDELLAEAMHLTPEQRLQLADRLFQSVEATGEAEVQAAWMDEIARRVEDVDQGRVRMVEHDEAMQTMFGEDPLR